MKIDLHVHSDRSDGVHPPAEVVRRAREAGLDVIALTDHDTTEGFEEAREAGKALGVEVVPGSEVSSTYLGRPVHVLGYFFDPSDPLLAGELEMIRDDRVGRARAMVDALRALGVRITFERVRELARGQSIGRPHVARAMVEAGAIRSVNDAFTPEWIADGGRAYVEKHAPAPADTVRLITDAGGVAVIAHPVWFAGGRARAEDVIDELRDAGLAGIEVNHPDHDPGTRARFEALAERLDLVPTGSSDWHGDGHGGTLGQFTTDPDAFRRLQERARKR